MKRIKEVFTKLPINIACKLSALCDLKCKDEECKKFKKDDKGWETPVEEPNE